MESSTHTFGPSYSVRINSWSPETTYWLAESSLIWKTAQREGSVSYDRIRDIRVYKIRYFGSRRSYWRFVICDLESNKFVLQASYYLSFRHFEDRSAAYY